MFEHWKEKHADRGYEKALASWQQERDAHAELVEMAEGFGGVDTQEIMLKNGERLFFKVTSVALIEDRVHGGHYEGRSSGVSVPIGSIGGRSVRYHVGAQRGHYVQGTPTPTAIDRGTVYITNQRVIFAGAKQTRECNFAKLIGAQHNDAEGATTFSVSNRQKPTTIFYGPGVAAAFDFRLELALAHFKGNVAEILGQVKSDLEAVDAERPEAPAGLPSGA
jgi:hypothetical protein